MCVDEEEKFYKEDRRIEDEDDRKQMRKIYDRIGWVLGGAKKKQNDVAMDSGYHTANCSNDY